MEPWGLSGGTKENSRILSIGRSLTFWSVLGGKEKSENRVSRMCGKIGERRTKENITF